MAPMVRDRDKEFACRAMFLKGAEFLDANPNLEPRIEHTTIDGLDAIVPVNPAGRRLIGAMIQAAPKSDYSMRNIVFTELIWYKQNGWDKYRRERQRARYLGEKI